MIKKGSSITCKTCKKSFYVPASVAKKSPKTCSHKCRDVLKRSLTYNDESEEKKCGKCGSWKPYSDYAPARGVKAAKFLGMQAYCVDCCLKVDREYKKNNKDRIRAIKKKSDLKNRERILKRVRNLSPEARARKNAGQRKYRMANMDKVLMWNRLRKAKQRVGGDMPDRYEIGAMLCGQDAKCIYCKEMLPEPYHIDHILPVSKGGTNNIENLQLLCPTCNFKKGAKTHEEYIAIL